MATPPRYVPQRGEDFNARNPDLSLVSALQTSYQDPPSSFLDGNQIADPFAISDGTPQRSTFDILGQTLDMLADDQFFQGDHGSRETASERIVIQKKKKDMGPPRQ